MKIILDIETTGLSPEKDEIIEFAAILVSDDLSIVSRLETLIRPILEPTEHITELTGITQDMLKHAPTIEQVIPTIQSFISTYDSIGHNIIKFDSRFLQKYNILIENQLVDTLEISRERKQTDKHSLDFLCDYYKIEREQKHRAMSDVFATLELYKLLI